MEISLCSPEETESVLAALDLEFVASRGRGISLRIRYPRIFSPNSGDEIWLARGQVAWVSCLVLRRFCHLAGARMLRGAMIGLVYTRREARGRGLAAKLLAEVANRLAREDLDFAVLWSGIPSFYQRLGWIPADRSCSGRGERPAGMASHGSAAFPVSGIDVERLEELRAQWCPQRVQRGKPDYLTTPLPADSVELFAHRLDQAVGAYALVGRKGQTGYVYEMIGSEIGILRLWEQISAAFCHLQINDAVGTASHHALKERADIIWSRQDLALWHPLRLDAAGIIERGLQIPWLDRI